MPGGPTMKIMGLAGLCREVKGLESLGVGHSGGDGLARVVERWHAGTLESCLGSSGVRYSYLFRHGPPKPVYELVDEPRITTPRQITNCRYVQKSRNPKHR
jgi:hypothetical protein